jgi:hypothetical protein
VVKVQVTRENVTTLEFRGRFSGALRVFYVRSLAHSRGCSGPKNPCLNPPSVLITHNI